MANHGKLKRDIDTLREIIRGEWQRLAEIPLSSDERASIRAYISECITDLKKLVECKDGALAKDRIGKSSPPT